MMEDQTRGIDWDLSACLENNPQNGFTVNDIEKVLAVFEGENDERDWRWVFQLKNGKFIFLQGGCDYTGWDCRSSAFHFEESTPDEAAKHALDNENDNPNEYKLAYHLLMTQVNDSKTETWREKTDKQLGIT